MIKYFTFFITLLISSTVAFSQTTLNLGRVIASGGPSSTVQVPLTVSTPLNNVKSISMQFSFDNTCVRSKHQASDMKSGISNFALADSLLAVTSNNGLISLSWINSTGVALNGKLLDLDFTYLSSFSEIKFVSATIKDMQGKKLIFDLSSGSIAADTIPAVKVVYPNGGELLEVVGAPVTIKWTSVYISNVNLDYTTDDGATWDSIVTNYPASKDSYTWTVPNTINSTECKIRVTDVEPAATSECKIHN